MKWVALLLIFCSILLIDNFHTFVNKIRAVKYRHLAISDSYLNANFRIKQQIVHNRKGVVFLGDSIMLGLREYDDRFVFKSTNWSIAGDTSALLLQRLKTYDLSHIESIHLMIGTNDIGRNKLPEHVIENIKMIVFDLSRCQCNISIYSVLLTNGMVRSNKLIKKLNDKLMELSKKLPFKYINLNDKLAPKGYLNKEYSTDGLHLNYAGYKVWIESYYKNASESM